MKKKTTFRAMLIVSAFALLTLPSMINSTSASASPPPAAPAYDCLGEFLSCLGNTGGDPMCIEQYVDCIGGRESK
jgi:hypothetical protein